jgi:hypothetical protein
MENYNSNKNSTGSFGKPKSNFKPKANKTTLSAASSSGMDSRWWLWYLKNQMQGSSEEKASS